MAQIGRRTLLTGVAGVGMGATPGLLSASTGWIGRTFQNRNRLAMPSGVQTGDVGTDSGVLWARSSSPGRLHCRLTSNGRTLRSIRGAWATPETDHTARLHLRGLPPGREYEATMWFADESGTTGEEVTARFATAAIQPAPLSFVWSADTCGQSWGINPDFGGLKGYRAMLDVRPDFFINAGDHIYADELIEENVLDSDGNVWRNQVVDGLDHVAETLADYRGRYAYVRSDAHVQALHAEVPVISMWDDHETSNNWWPGKEISPEEVLIYDKYTEKRVDVLAANARRAWQEWVPMPNAQTAGRGRDGFAENRIFRRIPRGPLLDVFTLDMRSFRSANTVNTEARETPLLGPVQADWLIREVTRSRATWKVIVADLPLSVNGAARDTGLFDSYPNGDDGSPLGHEFELARILRGFKDGGVHNVVFLTADVHYTAAHHYSPERAAVSDFNEFWEFVSGPIHASTFGAKDLDGTFGPTVVYQKGNDGISQSPLAGNQFFGQVEIAADGEMTVNLRDIGGRVLHREVLTPRAR